MTVRRWSIGARAACLAGVLLTSGWGRANGVPASMDWRPPATDLLADSVHHARMKFEREVPPYACHAPGQSGEVARNLVLWQNPDGGWPKNKDWFRVLGAAERAAVLAGRGKKADRSTLDNGSTWGQLAYLAQVRRHSGSADYDAALFRGVEYLLAAQRPSGGWRGSDVDAITFNDQVMVGVLRTLAQVAEDPSLYGFLAVRLRSQARGAFGRGLACLLRCQVRVDGKLTAWGQQHDHGTFRPIRGRRYEPPALAVRESCEIVEFLLEQDKSSKEVVQAVRAAADWLDSVRIDGRRLVSVPAEPVAYHYQLSTTDRILVEDPAAPPLWARFYDPLTRKPVFCSREGILLDRYEDLTRERRIGYEWLGTWPTVLLRDRIPAWQARP